MSERTAPREFVTLSDGEFETFSEFIETRIGLKMPVNKKKLLEARLQKRLRHHGFRTFTEYADLLLRSADSYGEISEFIDEVTTNKTDFFRDASHFDRLAELLKTGGARARSGPFRVWSVAASTGEEPYTIAMVCEEHKRLVRDFPYEVVGTDISYRALKTAVKGVYAGELIEPIPESLRKRYLLKGTGRYEGTVRFVPTIRGRVEFYRLNLMNGDYGMKKGFDVIFCRNVLIYFDKERQEAILRRVYDLLNPGGYLFMGPTEGMLAAVLPLVKINNNLFRRPENAYAG